jgi:hypothetical protein
MDGAPSATRSARGESTGERDCGARRFIHGNKPLGQRGLHSDVRVHLFDRDVVILNGGSVHELEDSIVEWIERLFRDRGPQAKLGRA